MQDLLQLQGGFCGFCVPPRGNGWKHIPVAVATQQTLAAWASSGISLQEVASSAVCKPRCMGWGFWQVEMRKVIQCHLAVTQPFDGSGLPKGVFQELEEF